MKKLFFAWIMALWCFPAVFAQSGTDIELNLAYGENNEAHKVVLRFTYSPYQYGVCLLTTKEMGFAFYLNQIYVDGKPTDYLQSTTTSKKYIAFLCQPAWKKK